MRTSRTRTNPARGIRGFGLGSPGGLNIPWDQTPPWVRGEFRASAISLVGNYPSYLPLDLDVGGFTMAEATRVLEELLARG